MNLFKKYSIFLLGMFIVFGSINTVANMGEVVDDTVITASVKGRLLANEEVAGLPITVETKNGIVILSGEIATEEEGCKAIEIAASTPHVIDVDASKLKIESSKQPFTDAMLTAKVKGIFLREKLFGPSEMPVMNIHVETKNGMIYLTGTAENTAQANKAKALAQSVKGVKSVKSSLIIKHA